MSNLRSDISEVPYINYIFTKANYEAYVHLKYRLPWIPVILIPYAFQDPSYPQGITVEMRNRLTSSTLGDNTLSATMRQGCDRPPYAWGQGPSPHNPDHDGTTVEPSDSHSDPVAIRDPGRNPGGSDDSSPDDDNGNNNDNGDDK